MGRGTYTLTFAEEVEAVVRIKRKEAKSEIESERRKGKVMKEKVRGVSKEGIKTWEDKWMLE